MYADRIRRPVGRAMFNIALLFFIDWLVMIIWSVISAGVYAGYLAARIGMLSADELWNRMAESPQALFLSCLYNLLAILLVMLFWRYIEKDSPEQMGLQWKTNSLKLFCAGSIAAVCEIALVILLGFFSGVLWYQQSGSSLYTVGQLADSVLFGVLAFLLVGFGEEVVYRGYILKRLMLSMKEGKALLLSAIIFAAAHLLVYNKPLDLLDVALGGIIMGYLYILSGSIFLPAGYHFVTDLLQVNIVRLQAYEGYKGAVLFIFGTAGDLSLLGVNWGSAMEAVFVAAELLILAVLYFFRNKISDRAIRKEGR